MAVPALDIARRRASLSAKLKNEANRRGVATDFVRKQYVFTIFLAQLFHQDDVPWVLLGGNALLIRTGSGRFTRDVDLAREEGWESPAAVVDELRKLLAVGKGKSDFAFILKSITPHAAPDDDGYGALTAKLQAEATLGGATFEKFSIDLTTRRHADAPVDQVALKRIINDESLNGLPKVPTIPVENHLADKVCALYEKHGVSGKGTSTRYRDLADIVRIIMATKFDAERLHVLLKREAGRRRIALPQTVVSPDVAWITRFPIAARDFAEYPAGLHPLKESLSFARRCLDAILDGSRRSGSWNPDQQQWENSTD